MSETLNFIGALCKDWINDECRPGGSVYYGAHTALKLGYKPNIITCINETDLKCFDLKNIAVDVLHSDQTLTFGHVYQNDQRQSQVLHRIEPFTPDLSALKPDITCLAPVFNEININNTLCFSLIIPQGWLRSLDDKNKVINVLPKTNPPCDLLVLSHDECPDPRSMFSNAKMIVQTHGRQNVKIFQNQDILSFKPAYKPKLIDPTGAGDVFATSLWIFLKENVELIKALTLASICAGMSIEGHGISAIPNRSQIFNHLRQSTG